MPPARGLFLPVLQCRHYKIAPPTPFLRGGGTFFPLLSKKVAEIFAGNIITVYLCNIKRNKQLNKQQTIMTIKTSPTVKEIRQQMVNNVARALRFHYDEYREIAVDIDRRWFEEQLAAMPTYTSWFEKNAPGCNADQSRKYDREVYTYYVDGNGRDLARFLTKYDHVIRRARFLNV